MRTTRAYIASAGTASVMLGAALAMLTLVSAFVAFGSWPGEKSATQVDQVLLNDIVNAKTAKVAVGSAAVKANRRAETRRQIAVARAERKRTGTSDRGGNPVAKAPAGGSAPTTAAGTPVASAPGDASPVNTVRQQTQDVTRNVTQNIQQTTENVGGQVQQQVDQTTTQVNEVVDQVVGGVQQQTGTTVQQVQDTVDTTTGTVKDTAGGLLGH
jgi:hypothetical protein